MLNFQSMLYQCMVCLSNPLATSASSSTQNPILCLIPKVNEALTLHGMFISYFFATLHPFSTQGKCFSKYIQKIEPLIFHCSLKHPLFLLLLVKEH